MTETKNTRIIAPQEITISAYMVDASREYDEKDAGVWVNLPADHEAVASALEAAGVSDAGYVFTGYRTVISGLEDAMIPFANLDELNYLAVKIAELTPARREVFGAIIRAGRFCHIPAQIINAIENLDMFRLQADEAEDAISTPQGYLVQMPGFVYRYRGLEDIPGSCRVMGASVG